MAAQGPQGRQGDIDRQEAIYREREAELVARHPDEFIVVCGDEVFVGRTFGEAESRAREAHPGRPLFSSMLHPPAAQGEDPGSGGDGHRVVDQAFEEDLARQREAFAAREDELLAENPGRSIAVCAGDVFVAGDDEGAISMAEAAHPGRAIYLCSYDPFFPCQCEQGGPREGRRGGEDDGADAAFEEDFARQREAFAAREDGLLAENPGRSIAVCAGDVFVAGDDEGAISMAEAAHPDRAIYLCSNDPFLAAR